MSEITRGAIGMPFEMAMESELSRRQFHSIAQALLGERDQLKAENEALRNGLRLARHWCASALKAARVDSQPSELLDIACLLRHQASDIDAAMGKGEQS